MTGKQNENSTRYHAYLLRLWRDNGGEPALWRASLESPQVTERLSFASLVDLFAFLEQETGLSKPGPEILDDGNRHPQR